MPKGRAGAERGRAAFIAWKGAGASAKPSGAGRCLHPPCVEILAAAWLTELCTRGPPGISSCSRPSCAGAMEWEGPGAERGTPRREARAVRRSPRPCPLRAARHRLPLPQLSCLSSPCPLLCTLCCRA